MAKAREEANNPAKPSSTVVTPTDMPFLELVNKRLVYVKAYNSERHYIDHLYLAKRWVKLWSKLRCSEITGDMIQNYLLKPQRIDQLQDQQEYTTRNLDVLTRRLEELKEERRRVATMFRRNLISEDEMADQLQVVGDEEIEITEQIANAGDDYGDELEKIRGLSRVYRDYLAEGLDGLDNEPNDPELFKRWSATVKGIIQAFVQRVDVDDQLKVTIYTHIDLRTKLPLDKRVYSSESLVVSLGNKTPMSKIMC